MLLLSVVILAAAASVEAVHDVYYKTSAARTKQALPYVTALKELRLANDKVKEVLFSLQYETDLEDVNLHTYLPLGAVHAAADLLLSQRSLSPVVAYKRAVNRKLALVLKDPVGSRQELLEHLEDVEKALFPLLQLVRQQCYDVDEKSCDELVQVYLDRDPELAKVGELLDRVKRLAQLYLRLEEGLQLAARDYGGLGFSLTRVDELSTLSAQLAQVLLAADALLNPDSDTTDGPYYLDE